MSALELLLVNRVLVQTAAVEEKLPDLAAFRHNWIYEVADGPAGAKSQIRILRKKTSPVSQLELWEKDPLEWFLVQLKGNPDLQTHYDHAMLFSFLEYHMANSHRKEKARLDENFYRKLSDLSAWHEMLVAVRLHRPQNIARHINEVQNSEHRRCWKTFALNHPFGLEEATAHKENIALGTALHKGFYDAYSKLPTGKKSTEWLAGTQAIRESIERFWAGFRYCSKATLKQLNLSDQDITDLLEVISANLTPEYILAIETEEKEHLAAIEAAKAPSVSIQTEWGSNTPDAPSQSTRNRNRKRKNKSQPVAESDPTEEVSAKISEIDITAAPDPTINPPSPSLTIRLPVSKRAYDAITLLFPQSPEESAKGLDWNSFVHAMADMNFVARNAGGSAVRFQKNGSVTMEKDGGGKIVLHRPHPENRVDPVILHSWGKRMKKWFGWERELFVLEQ
ncbi:hypothetical protein G7Y89_g10331 [Cudoniella acicularis]|uniref:Uncharacterized protein n=1 Tax=Cudoniella acicularis TaxID=354080 RepID=A0A8H4W1R2_9HELO|nr:hypothetical protein G7Y89_g10331 [Cudoniella acicularis]